jgi:hypothetical protein
MVLDVRSVNSKDGFMQRRRVNGTVISGNMVASMRRQLIDRGHHTSADDV